MIDPFTAALVSTFTFFIGYIAGWMQGWKSCENKEKDLRP